MMSAVGLHHVEPSEIRRVLTQIDDRHARAELFADLCRINVLYMVMRAGSGHLGSSFSAIDIISWLHLEVLREPEGDVFFSSKGHDAPALYSVLIALGRLDADLLHRLRRLDGLPGHPDVRTPGIAVNSGSLGMGISKAKGLLAAAELEGSGRRVIVMTGDGELQEGQIWESLQGAALHGLANLRVIVDHNRIQSDTWVSSVSDLGPLEAKFEAFGWTAERCDGHDLRAVERCLGRLDKATGPGVLIAETVKGRGVTGMEPPLGMTREGRYRFHSGAPSFDDYQPGVEEVYERCRARLERSDVALPELLTVRVEQPPPPRGARLVDAYRSALVERGNALERVVALDADLVVDCGVDAFAAQFPTRFIECGIAEQDMVSQAGGLALGGQLPIVHSFSCFLTTRANEQIFNNATEATRIVYVGALAGLIPAAPGHSHQSVRDLSLMSSIPGMLCVEPSHPDEVAPLLAYLTEEHAGPSYLRLVSAPVDLPTQWEHELPAFGRGHVLVSGADAWITAYGPLMLRECLLAVAALRDEHGLSCGVIALPWLNRVDKDWLRSVVGLSAGVVTIDNHVTTGGQGLLVTQALQDRPQAPCTRGLAVEGIATCGSADEVLAAHGLDAKGIARAVIAMVS